MNVPKAVSDYLSEKAITKWETLLLESANGDWDFCGEEGIWRRSQCEENKQESGWKRRVDGRRRMLHYKHKYDLGKSEKGDRLVIKESYIWIHYLLPIKELRELKVSIKDFLKSGNWIQIEGGAFFNRGDLVCEIAEGTKHPMDVSVKREIPDGYGYIECRIYTKHFSFDENFCKRPWNVLNTGIRKKDVRGIPKEIKDFAEIKEYLPAQVEIGCGPSIEAGVAPLNFLHSLYSVADHTGKFIFSYPEDTFIKRILSDPDNTYEELAEMFHSVLEAKSTSFYEVLNTLYREQLFVGPVITNNFDCIIPAIGIPQLYVRRFEEKYFHPNISFDKRAKSLWVVGSHADRRGIQKLARSRGLKVFYIDPEGYFDSAGNFETYRLESPQDEDILLVAKASDAFKKLEQEIL